MAIPLARVAALFPVLGLALALLSPGAPLAHAEPDRAPHGRATAARSQRRQRVRDEIGNAYALLLGQPITDVLQPRQEGDFLYVIDLDEPDAALLMAGTRAAPLRASPEDGGVREILFVQDHNPRFAQFYGTRRRPGRETERALGIESVRALPGNADAWGRLLAGLLPKGAHLRVPEYAGPDSATVRERRKSILQALAGLRADLVVEDLHPLLAGLRSVKDEIEIAAIEQACGLTATAFREALVSAKPGATEGALEGLLLAAIRAGGGRPAYPFVVAAGANSVFPHYFLNEATLAKGDLLLIDAGASVDRYAADVTRTVPVSGRFSARQREIYDIVFAAQSAAIAAVRPGADFGAVDLAARRVIAQAGYGDHFLHATSHHVGLDVHDPGPRLLVPGMTLTVEPGIYLADEGIGVRIEDVVLVTPEGSRILTDHLPREAGAVEDWMGARGRAPAPGPPPEDSKPNPATD